MSLAFLIIRRRGYGTALYLAGKSLILVSGCIEKIEIFSNFSGKENSLFPTVSAFGNREEVIDFQYLRRS